MNDNETILRRKYVWFLAGGLAFYNYVSEGKTYDFSSIGGPAEYVYGKNEPLDCLQSDAERGWFNDKFLQF